MQTMLQLGPFARNQMIVVGPWTPAATNLHVCALQHRMEKLHVHSHWCTVAPSVVDSHLIDYGAVAYRPVQLHAIRALHFDELYHSSYVTNSTGSEKNFGQIVAQKPILCILGDIPSY